jgi:hypothetical protein
VTKKETTDAVEILRPLCCVRQHGEVGVGLWHVWLDEMRVGRGAMSWISKVHGTSMQHALSYELAKVCRK